MNKIKIKILKLGILVIVLFLPQFGSAIGGATTDWGLSSLGITGLPTDSPGAFIGRIITWVLGLIGVILIALIVYGGFLYMTSVGNEDQVARAKATLTYAVIGVVVVVVSYILADYILNAVFGT